MRLALVVFLLVACSSRAPAATETQTGEAAPSTAARTEPAPAAAPAPSPTPSAEPTQDAPPPAVGPDPEHDPAYACARTEDCELVQQGCNSVEAVNHAFAAEKRARNDRLLSIATCGGMPIDAVSFVCERSVCRTHPMTHPELRRCHADRGCTTIDSNCTWHAVSTRDEAAARRAFPVGRACPGIMSVQPVAHCTFGFCAYPGPAR